MARSSRRNSSLNQPEHERRDFFLFIDEFHNFTTDAFASILAEARKYRLCLSLSHQYIEQFPLPVRQAVLGNVRTLVSFRIGNTDAEGLSREFGETFPPANFVDLDRYEVLVKLMKNGANPEPFRARTLAPIEHRVGKREKLIARFREKYAASRADVEATWSVPAASSTTSSAAVRAAWSMASAIAAWRFSAVAKISRQIVSIGPFAIAPSSGSFWSMRCSLRRSCSPLRKRAAIAEISACSQTMRCPSPTRRADNASRFIGACVCPAVRISA